jgi:hypothetical protein
MGARVAGVVVCCFVKNVFVINFRTLTSSEVQ